MLQNTEATVNSICPTRESFPDSSVGKKIRLQCRRPQFDSLGREDPLEKEKATHSSILGLPFCLSW